MNWNFFYRKAFAEIFRNFSPGNSAAPEDDQKPAALIRLQSPAYYREISDSLRRIHVLMGEIEERARMLQPIADIIEPTQRYHRAVLGCLQRKVVEIRQILERLTANGPQSLAWQRRAIERVRPLFSGLAQSIAHLRTTVEGPGEKILTLEYERQLDSLGDRARQIHDALDSFIRYVKAGERSATAPRSRYSEPTAKESCRSIWGPGDE